MKRLLTVFSALFLCVYNINTVSAMPIKAQQPDNLRIKDLLPGLVYPLAVNPAIPADFVARTPTGASNLMEAMYWGPKEVLKKGFNPRKLNTPVIKVSISQSVAQTGPHSFNHEDPTALQESLTKNFGSITNFIVTKWGNYPVISAQTKVMDTTVCLAWVGLNEENGTTLLFDLIYPNEKGRSNKSDLQLWDDFIRNTTALKGVDFFKVHGQDLQEGYTLQDLGPAKIKIIAEKRQRDGMIQVVVLPQSSDLKYKFTAMEEDVMVGQWKKGEPLVKVFSQVEMREGSSKFIQDNVTPIFYKTVSEFSYNIGNKKLLIFQKKIQ